MKRKVQVWIHCKNQKGKQFVLILKTTPKRKSFWQPITGGVKRGESLRDAALREAQEETGLKFLTRPRPLHFKFTFQARRGLVSETVFEMEVKSRKNLLPKVKIDPSEHTRARWSSIQEARARLKFAFNRKALRCLEKILAKKESST